MPFKKMRLAEPLLRAIDDQGYEVPTAIQEKSIPHVIEGRDLLGCAQTGTGKTAAFALPILHLLHRYVAQPKENGKKRAPTHQRPIRALVLTPTRELAAQIGDNFQAYGRHTPLKHTVIFGGVKQRNQCQALKRGVDILVATPGRLLDLLNQRQLSLSKVEILVLDEADRMLDMGFIQDIRKAISHIPEKRQTLLFSATMPTVIRKFADTLLDNPVTVKIKAESPTADNIEQGIYHIDQKRKSHLLEQLLKDPDFARTLIFSRTKRGTERIATRLQQVGIDAETIHSDKSQGARQRALKNFKQGHSSVLIASDIASRGLDVDDITHVINYDMPHDTETYVHRIGRTGRAGAGGQAISFCSSDDRNILRDIERMLKKPIPVLAHSIAPAPRNSIKKPRATHPMANKSGKSKPRRPIEIAAGSGGSGGTGGTGGSGAVAVGVATGESSDSSTTGQTAAQQKRAFWQKKRNGRPGAASKFVANQRRGR